MRSQSFTTMLSTAAVVAAVLFVSSASALNVTNLRFSHPVGSDSRGFEVVKSPASYFYNEADARSCVYLSAIAYCEKSSILSYSCKACKEFPDARPVAYAYDSGRNVAAWVGRFTQGPNEGTGIVSFRGTNPSSLKDWIDDLGIAFTTPAGGCGDGCEVHSGFWDSYNALRPQIVDAIQSAGISKLWITGHSLGAAMAALASFDLSTEIEVDRVYTMGQPRVGNSAFASYYETLSVSEYRLVHNADIVPHLPPMKVVISTGYHHLPTEVWYNEASTSYQICNGSGEDPNCSDSLSLPDSISDHRSYLGYAISDSC